MSWHNTIGCPLHTIIVCKNSIYAVCFPCCSINWTTWCIKWSPTFTHSSKLSRNIEHKVKTSSGCRKQKVEINLRIIMLNYSGSKYYTPSIFKKPGFASLPVEIFWCSNCWFFLFLWQKMRKNLWLKSINLGISLSFFWIFNSKNHKNLELSQEPYYLVVWNWKKVQNCVLYAHVPQQLLASVFLMWANVFEHLPLFERFFAHFYPTSQNLGFTLIFVIVCKLVGIE